MARKTRARFDPRQQSSWHYRSHHAAQLGQHPNWFRARGFTAPPGQTAPLVAVAGRQRRDIDLGPIPKDVPVGLLANLKLRAESDDPVAIAAHIRDTGELLLKLKLD